MFADWTVLPGLNPEQPIARLMLGTQKAPISLDMTSNLAFTIQGQGQLQLFAGLVTVTGELDMSQNHVMISGELDFLSSLLIEEVPLVGLKASGEGLLGPGDFVEFAGAGEITLFGQPFVAADVRIRQQIVEFSASLSGAGKDWLLASLPLVDCQFDMQASVDFRQQRLQMMLAGQGAFGLFGAKIEGQCQALLDISPNNPSLANRWTLTANGRLFWLGRHWLDGAVTLSDQGARLQGKTDFSIDLTPTQLPANIQIAGLYLNAAISGEFSLNSVGQLISWEFDLDWQLAIKLPGTGNNQSLPIATQQLNVKGSHAATNSRFNLVDLIQFDGITLFDLSNITVPIPSIDMENGEKVYLHNSANVFPGKDGVEFSFLTPVRPSGQSDDDAVLNIAFFKAWEQNLSLDIPSIDLPIPMLSNQKQLSSDEPLFVIPEVDLTNQSLGQVRLDNAAFHLKLAWKNNELGVLVVDKDLFVPFSSNFTLLIGIVGSLVLD
jgi:hypothetical protein